MVKKKNISVAQRIDKASKLSTKLEIVSEWAKNQQNDFFDSYKQLEDAVGRDDLADIHHALDRLKTIGIKSFGSLSNIAKKLTYPKNMVRLHFRMSDPAQKRIYNLLQNEPDQEQLILNLLKNHYGVDNE